MVLAKSNVLVSITIERITNRNIISMLIMHRLRFDTSSVDQELNPITLGL